MPTPNANAVRKYRQRQQERAEAYRRMLDVLAISLERIRVRGYAGKGELELLEQLALAAGEPRLIAQAQQLLGHKSVSGG
jgi:hypothetical protein